LDVVIFALFSPTVTQAPFTAQDRFARDALLTEIFQVARAIIDSTESLFEA
jgi:hypothetical protein